MLRLLFVFILIYIAGPVAGQLSDNYTIREYTTENGLPSNGIKGLQWDESAGMLWIATEAGIVRFNGLEFKTFTGDGSLVVSDNRVLFMLRNYANEIRSVDEGRNIFTVAKNKLLFVRKDPPSKDPFHGKFFTLGISDQFMQSDRRPTAFYLPVHRIVPINDTTAIVLKDGNLIYYSLNLENPMTLPKGSKFVKKIFRIGEHVFIADNNGDLLEMNLTTFQFKLISSFKLNGIPSSLAKENNLVFWDNGMKNPVLFNGSSAWLLSYDGKEIVTKLISDAIPPDALIRYVQYSEKLQTLFLGTDSKGIVAVSPKHVNAQKKKHAKYTDGNAYYAQIELPDNNVLTNQGHVIGPGRSQSDALPVTDKFLRSVFHTSDSSLWYIKWTASHSFTCLHRYNYKTRQTTVYEKIKLPEFMALCESRKEIYIATPSGIAKLSGDTLLYLVKFSEQDVFVIQETAPGVLVVAGCKGLYRFDIQTKKLDTLFSPGACIRSMWNYNGYLFFGTYGKGFFVYHNGVVKPMPLDKNNYLLFAHCFVDDGNGFCWISTNRGLFKASIKEMINAFDHNLKDVYYHYLGRNDGMEMTELNGGCVPCALKLKNGSLSFPTMDGLLGVDPLRANMTLPDGDLYLDEVRIDNQQVNPDSLAYELLPSATNEIVFELAYSGWCNEENIYIDYQLDDTAQWKKLNLGIIRFENLSPGKHRLRVRKVNGFGVDNYSYLNVMFSIKKQWYKQWWFFSLQVVAIIGLFTLFYHIRTNRFKKNAQRLENLVAEKTRELKQKNEVLEKNNTIKTRLISIISHDIITPLKFLSVAGKNLLEKKGQIPEDLQEETIREMTNTSQELQTLSMNILNWIKYQNENRLMLKEKLNVSDLVNQVINILNSLAKRKQLQLVNAADKQLTVYQFYEPLKILIYNLVSNSIAFSEKGSIVISSQQNENEVVITVKDEGLGMREDQIRHILADQTIITSANVDNKKGHGLGFMIIKDLIKMMGASVSIQSKQGQGTSVHIHIPVPNETI